MYYPNGMPGNPIYVNASGRETEAQSQTSPIPSTEPHAQLPWMAKFANRPGLQQQSGSGGSESELLQGGSFMMRSPSAQGSPLSPQSPLCPESPQTPPKQAGGGSIQMPVQPQSRPGSVVMVGAQEVAQAQAQAQATDQSLDTPHSTLIDTPIPDFWEEGKDYKFAGALKPGDLVVLKRSDNTVPLFLLLSPPSLAQRSLDTLTQPPSADDSECVYGRVVVWVGAGAFRAGVREGGGGGVGCPRRPQPPAHPPPPLQVCLPRPPQPHLPRSRPGPQGSSPHPHQLPSLLLHPTDPTTPSSPPRTLLCAPAVGARSQ
eukprot:572137-Rhodomonas_salina.1